MASKASIRYQLYAVQTDGAICSKTECPSTGKCSSGTCKCPVCKPIGQTCAANGDCCDGLCSKDKKCVNPCQGSGADNCAVCPSATAATGPFEFKVCADAPNDSGTKGVGQATCGTNTCTAVCNAVCGDKQAYAGSDCSNAGGGNCQGAVTSTGFPFNGGPCCGCKKCKV